MTDDDAWRMEERLWTAGPAHYRNSLDPQCIMAFAPPAGIVAGPDIARSLEDAPRWSSVEMTDRHLAQPQSELLVLAYRARGSRDGAGEYKAYCTSTYRRAGERWRLIQHQQTPA